MSRFTASMDSKGDWLVFDNEDFYCCYGPTSEHDAISEMIKLNNRNSSADEITRLKERIAELEAEIKILEKGLVVGYWNGVEKGKRIKGGDI